VSSKVESTRCLQGAKKPHRLVDARDHVRARARDHALVNACANCSTRLLDFRSTIDRSKFPTERLKLQFAGYSIHQAEQTRR
jgi:hypothetical protein